MIHVGTSGYSFKDWKGPFYPEGLAASRMLDYYCRVFDIVEVNATYYRIPATGTIERMASKTPAGFLFTVKTHQSLTHERKGDTAVDRAFLESVRPLAEREKLLGLLVQFPWSFRCTRENVDYVRSARDAMAPHALHVEFRHADWARPETFAFLRREGIGYCIVDEPRLPGLMPPVVETTTDTAYFRFHGRNTEDWWRPRPGSDRYLYDYSDAELEEWAPRIREADEKCARVVVMMNNCHFGHAPRNARRLREILGVEEEPENDLCLEP